MKYRFVIFSLPRCGSTTLQRLLNCHEAIRCIGEPFHRQLGKFRQRVTDTASLTSALHEIWATHNGIRHTWELSGWPFPGGSRLNDELLLDPGHKIILLTRRNILRRIVSHHISSQTQIWSYFDESDREKVRRFKFKPIDFAWVEDQLAREPAAVGRCGELLARRGAGFVELTYERLYDRAASQCERLGAFNAVLTFLGYDAIVQPGALDRVAALFDERNTKLNSAETYHLIPNIEDVERTFGSEETGWLFRETTAGGSVDRSL